MSSFAVRVRPMLVCSRPKASFSYTPLFTRRQDEHVDWKRSISIYFVDVSIY